MGTLFLGYSDWRRRWIGFLLVSGGAAQIGCTGETWATIMSVGWLVFVMLLVVMVFLEDPKKN